ncbi:hypothetical protein GCM10010462_27050 [Microbacterium dextranolyticum]|uniref:DUF559 domain-containing protein n=1 Tax=Microbacterium dextranolyticum TaxID=36806 RepID=A0A9W6HNB7_9MICO|nr:hypothetical protein GCM10017591_25030 [Microbacterium dextranolyticum]
MPASLGVSFTCAEALAQGVSRRRLRAGDLETPFRGARLIRSEPDPFDAPGGVPYAQDRAIGSELLRRASAYSAVAPAGILFVGAVAFAAHGLPLRSEWKCAALTVGVHPPAHAARAQGVRGVKISRRLVRVVDVGGLPVADAVSAWALSGVSLDLDALTVIGDAIVRVPRDAYGRACPEAQHATIDDLRAAALVPWRRGRENLLDAIELIRVGSMSPLETRFRLAAARAGLPEPELDVEIFDRHGARIGISDAVYRGHRVVVEIEGRQHALNERQWNRDLDKYAALAAAGWEVVRITARHLDGDRPRAVEIVRDALARHPLV